MFSLTSLIRLTLSCAACIAASAAPAVAAPSWVGASDVSPPGENAFSETVRVDPHGNALAVMSVENGSNQDLRASFRPAGGSWQAPVTLATTTSYFVSPQIAFDGQGDAAVVWSGQEASGWRARIAVRLAATGTWRPTADICQVNQDCAMPRIAVGDDGSAIAVWEYSNGANWEVDGAAGSIVSGTWQQATRLSTSGANAHAPALGLDASGDATAVWYQYNGSVAIIQSATRSAQGGVWTAPEPVSAAGLDTAAPQLAVDPNGDAVAVWESYDGKVKRVYSAARVGQGGAWSPPGPLSAFGAYAESPEVATDAAGHATAIWRRSNGTNWIAEAADLIDKHGSWGAAHQLSPAGNSVSDPQIAVDQHGDAFATWEVDVSGTNRLVQGAARPAAQVWPPASTLSGVGEDAELPAVAADNAGDGVVVWTRTGADNIHAQRGAVFDATPPTLSAISIPTAGTAGRPVPFSATPTDAWSAVGTTWDFGDGGAGTGTSLAHTYAKAGSYTVTVTSTDAAGFTAQSTGTIAIAPAPPPPGSRTGHKPWISAASLAPVSFRPARSDGVVSARGRRGSVLRFTLSSTASLRIDITRAAAGLSSGRRCVALNARLKRAQARRCTRTVTLGVLRLGSARAGRNAVAFSGRVRGRALKVGRYRATLTARNAYGVSSPISLRFRIVR